MSRLPADVVAAVVGVVWALVGVFWLVLSRWEKSHVSAARQRELEALRARGVPLGLRAWRASMVLLAASIPLLFVIDRFAYRLEIVYSQSLSFFSGPDLLLQVVGVALSVTGLAILIGVGRKLAVNVYRLAADERALMTTGVHRLVRHPFYIHFFLVPLGTALVSLNYLAVLLIVPYSMIWEPRPVPLWMRDEEADLRRRHGAEAEAYLRRTGRVFPRLRRGL